MFTSLLTLLLFFSPAVVGADEFRDPATGIDFPVSLGSLDRTGLTRYRTPEMGFSVRYVGLHELKSDTYVYTAGVAKLGTGETEGVVLSHYAEVKQAVFGMGEKGSYKDVMVASEGKVSLHTPDGPLPMLHAVMQYSDSEGLRVSHIYVGTYNDHFVKIRFTYLAKYRVQGDAALRSFLQDFQEILN